MNNVTKLHSWVEATLDEMEFSRLQRAQEIAVMDQEAICARPHVHNSLLIIADQIANSGVQLWPADVLVLMHSIRALARKNSNQHLYVWESFNTEAEGIHALMQEAFEDELRDAGVEDGRDRS